MNELLEKVLENVSEEQKKEIELDVAISKSYQMIKSWIDHFEVENPSDLLILNTFCGIFSYFVQEIKKTHDGFTGHEAILLMADCLERLMNLMRATK